MGEAKYSLFSKRTPNERQGDEVYDKWKQQDNIDRELDIREGKLKADEKARKEAKRGKYKGETDEEWRGLSKSDVTIDGISTNWKGIGEEIKSQSSSLFVQIQDSDMSDADKARYTEQLESNPDALITLFTEFNTLADEIRNNENLDPDVQNGMLSELNDFISGGAWTVSIDPKNGYKMSIIDKENKNPFSVSETMGLVNKKKSDYKKYNIDIATDKYLQDNNLARKGTDGKQINAMRVNGRWKLRPAEGDEGYMNTYDNLFYGKRYSNDPKGEKMAEKKRQFIQDDLKMTEAWIKQENAKIDARNKPKEVDEIKTQWNHEDVKVFSKPDGGVSSMPVVEGGRLSDVPVTGLTNDGVGVSGTPIKIEYDDYGNPTSITLSTINPTALTEYRQGDNGKFMNKDGTTLTASEFVQVFGSNPEKISLVGGENRDNLNRVLQVFSQHIDSVKKQLKNSKGDEKKETAAEEIERRTKNLNTLNTKPEVSPIYMNYGSTK